MSWSGKRVLVTGGASFIGSHLVDRLVDEGADVLVVDDLSSGRRENLSRHLEGGTIKFLEADLLSQDVVRTVVRGQDVIFHLAADHGGRGYIDRHQVACATNLLLDAQIFRQCAMTKVGQVVYASSGCVYPSSIHRPLREEDAGPPYAADGMYGWAKLMGELTLRAYHREHGLSSVSCRYFTAYGPRGHESHAVMAMIARAFIRQDPFEVWGDGAQVRNWTHVDDIVEGTLRAAEKITDGSAINIGTEEPTRVFDAVAVVLDYVNFHPMIQPLPSMPVGPVFRVADGGLSRRLLGFEPKVKFSDGLRRTIDWYFLSKDRGQVAASLDSLLTERSSQNGCAAIT